jgi:hypothetical protein
MHWLRPTFFAAYGLGALGMALIDVFIPEHFTSQTSFGHSAGWLREIAAFDVLVAYLCAVTVREPDGSRLVTVHAAGLALLSLGIGSNNALAFATSGKAAHLQACLIHYVACAAGVVVWRNSRRAAL